jgi:prepilin-type N-terminal cleavage/methylation domain-containing protein
MKSRKAGLTLLEVLIASAILSAVALLAFVTLFSSTSLATKGSISSRLEQRGIRFISACRDDMSAAQFSQSIALGGNPANFSLGIPGGTPNSYNTAVGYRVPGNRNASGATNATLTVVYGYGSPFRQVAPAVDGGFYQDAACVLRFEADEVFREDGSGLAVTQAANWGAPFPAYPALTVSSVAFDLNGDGDRTDAFVRGKIVKYVLAPTGSYLAGAHAPLQLNGTAMPSNLLSRETMSDNVMLRVNSSAAGDFNADLDGHGATNSGVIFGFADPVTGVLNRAITSSPNAAGIQITIWHGDYDDTGKRFILRKNGILIHFRPGSQG